MSCSAVIVLKPEGGATIVMKAYVGKRGGEEAKAYTQSEIL